MDLRSFIRDIPDFPKPGIVFKDITPLLGDAKAFRYTIDQLRERYANQSIAKVVAIESRGFLFGAPLAERLGCGLVPVRKLGKLPYRTIAQAYDLEYGQDTLQIHEDALEPGERVLIVDDLLATGGTLAATAQLVEKVGGRVHEIVTVIELTFLKGRERLRQYPYYGCLQF